MAPHVPVRPVIPWGEYALQAGGQLANAAQYLSPQYKAQVGLANAQISMAPQQLALQRAQLNSQMQLLPQQTQIQQQQLDMERRMMDQFQSGQGSGNMYLGPDGKPRFWNQKDLSEISKNNATAASANQRTGKNAMEIQNSNDLDAQAAAVRAQYLQQHPQLPSDSSSSDLSGILIPPDLPPTD